MDKEIKEVFKNKYIWVHLIALLFLFITWFWTDFPKTIRILSFFLVVVSQFSYNVKVKIIDDFYFRFLQWVCFVLVLLFAILYLASSVGDIKIAMFFYFITPFVLLIGFFIPNVYALRKSRNVLEVIIYYIIVVFIGIIIFGYGFIILSAFGGNELENTWDYLYFSSQIFYSNNFGDIVPIGLSRLLAVIEIVFSAIIHIIVLGTIINRISGKNKE
jgi:hypothetical protein